jgi:hypothetical protein
MQESYDRLDLELDRDELRFIAENLSFLAGVDEGENTDHDRLLEVVRKIETALDGEVDTALAKLAGHDVKRRSS